jgi:hypothetical protein
MIGSIIGSLLIALILWAVTFDGGLHELKQLNPKFVHSDTNVAYLVTELHSTAMSKGELPSSMRIEDCALYMPNWDAAKRCVIGRGYCERQKPEGEDIVNYVVSDDRFRQCFNKRKPFQGPLEFFRALRPLIRILVGWPISLVNSDWHNGLNQWVNAGK